MRVAQRRVMVLRMGSAVEGSFVLGKLDEERIRCMQRGIAEDFEKILPPMKVGVEAKFLVYFL